ncbi:alanine racemase [Rhodophyticola sp. CCM32]|uniref:alanine racemase n=1 Tax=Rhodophyticola sp. CCM32 TaxID=2916397 RepID=UPI00143D540D|nr:alanine racemase C-terminal domain-containing protein [Rhodophyticola sp. CCM32]
MAVQLDLGLHRLGFGMEELDHLISDPQWCAEMVPDLMLAHLPSGNDRLSQRNVADRDRFLKMTAQLSGFRKSVAASSGIFLGAEFHFDVVRPGSALFGINPMRGSANPMLPVVTLESRIIQRRHLKAGTRFGYDRSFTAEQDMLVGIVSFGAMDGVLFSPRPGQKISVFLDTHTAPVIGSGGSDTLFVDLSDVPDRACREGQIVSLINHQHDLETCAFEHGITEYELLARLGSRLPRKTCPIVLPPCIGKQGAINTRDQTSR